MSIVLNGTTGITTPDVTSDSYTGALAVDTSAPDDSLVVDASGNLGLGVTPSAWINTRVVLQNRNSSFFTSTTNPNYTAIGANVYRNGSNVNTYIASSYASMYAQDDSNHIWYTAPSGTAGNAISFTQAMTLTSAGNLLVGTTSANGTEKFNVTSASTEVAFFQNSSNTSGYSGIRSNIGSGGSNTSTWHFRGETRGYASYYLYGNGTTSYSSDIRLKKNVQTARGYLEDLNKLRVVKYQWKGEDPDCQQVELGLIAQEVEEVFPNLIQEHEVEGVGNMKHIKQSVLPFMMLKAIQEQQAIIEALTARVSALEASNV